MDAAQKAKAESMREGLERLWQSFQQRDWREYGLIAANVSSPSRPFGRTHASVLEAFGEAEVT